MFIIFFFIIAIIYSFFAKSDQKKRGKKLPMKTLTEEQFMELNWSEKEKIFEAHHEWNNGGNIYKLFNFNVVCKKTNGKITYLKTFKEWGEETSNVLLKKWQPIIKPQSVDSTKENMHQEKAQDDNQKQLSNEKEIWLKRTVLLLNNSISAIELKEQKNIYEIGYSDLLNCFEWHFMRLKVLIRDAYKCKSCGIVSDLNHVHHKFYIQDQLPWEIDEDALETQCRTCHRKIHDTTNIKVFKKVGLRLEETNKLNIYCTRCAGSGYLPQFKHVQNGVCFRCKGDCIDRTIFSYRLEKLNSINAASRSDCQSFLSEISNETFLKKIKPLLKDDFNLLYSPNQHEPHDDLPF